MAVVEFPAAKPSEPKYWVCRCGCMTHYIREDRSVECVSCEQVDSGFLLDLPDGPPTTNAEPFAVHHYAGGAGDFASERFARRVTAGEFWATVGIRKDGRVVVLADGLDVETLEQRRWLARRLRDAFRLLVHS